jgi:hypothetical protein
VKHKLHTLHRRCLSWHKIFDSGPNFRYARKFDFVYRSTTRLFCFAGPQGSLLYNRVNSVKYQKGFSFFIWTWLY